MINRLLESTTNATNDSLPTNGTSNPCVRVGTTIIYSGKTPILIPAYKGDCPISSVPLWYWLGPLLGVIGLILLCGIYHARDEESRQRSARSLRNIRDSFRRPQSDRCLLFSCCRKAPEAGSGNTAMSSSTRRQAPEQPTVTANTRNAVTLV
jgi:hypothetical protein